MCPAVVFSGIAAGHLMKGRNMYNNYVFDLYGTLVDIHTDEENDLLWQKMSLFYGYHGAVYTPRELQAAYVQQVGQEENLYSHEAYPEIRLDEVFRCLYENKGVDPEDALVLHTGQMFRALSTEYLRLYPGVTDLLEALKKQGKRVWLLTNAQRIFTAFELKLLGIEKYFDGILISSDYGTKKPELKFYRALLEKYELDPGECIMIGNDALCDIAGGRAAGMDTLYIHSNLSPQVDSPPEATYVLMEMDMQQAARILMQPEK